MSTENQPPESKGEHPTATPWEYKPNRRGVYGNDGLLVASVFEDIDGHFIAEAGAAYHESGLTPMQLLKDRNDWADACGKLQAEREDLLGVFPSDAPCRHEETQVSIIDEVRDLLKDRDQLEAVALAAGQLRKCDGSNGSYDSSKAAACGRRLDKALDQQPAEALEKREEEREDTHRINALEKLLIHCPHARLSYNDDADVEDEFGPTPVGFRLLVDGCETTDFRAESLRVLLDQEIQHIASATSRKEEA